MFSNSFVSSIIRSCNHSLALSCTLSLPSHPGIFLVFCSAIVCPDLCLDIFFPNRLSLSAAPPIWPSWQYIILLLARILQKSFGHLHLSPAGPLADGDTELQRHLHSFLQFSDAHFHITSIIKISQRFFCQVLEGNPSPSPIFHQYPVVFFFSS